MGKCTRIQVLVEGEEAARSRRLALSSESLTVDLHRAAGCDSVCSSTILVYCTSMYRNLTFERQMSTKHTECRVFHSTSIASCV